MGETEGDALGCDDTVGVLVGDLEGDAEGTSVGGTLGEEDGIAE